MARHLTGDEQFRDAQIAHIFLRDALNSEAPDDKKMLSWILGQLAGYKRNGQHLILFLDEFEEVGLKAVRLNRVLQREFGNRVVIVTAVRTG